MLVTPVLPKEERSQVPIPFSHYMSGGRVTESIPEGVPVYCEGVAKENEYHWQRGPGTILRAIEKALRYSMGLNRRTSHDINPE